MCWTTSPVILADSVEEAVRVLWFHLHVCAISLVQLCWSILRVTD